jgi:hypothetical protein
MTLGTVIRGHIARLAGMTRYHIRRGEDDLAYQCAREAARWAVMRLPLDSWSAVVECATCGQWRLNRLPWSTPDPSVTGQDTRD